ncbi:MAG: cyclase/dehydrase [Actinophytocola sp.]|uniref:type II toxin-antitoxin system RatA family toxin n=1 Tax=Actinophytocola sp. TaxID=1872138 RepID=UPI00132B5B33|nr:SRPBCC family protein [Actinophytocola sp.]MPZ82410.1 cyclase/dehydrase [Actinophytocola sp.]
MRSVALTVHIAARDARAALARIAEFERYPGLAADVRHVAVRGEETDWVVNFRRGPMRWTETETVDPQRLRIEFEQLDGDFASFHGSWQLVPGIGGCVVRFEVSYDFGVESLAGIMDPIAERVIKRVVCDVLASLFGPTSVLEGGEALSDLGRAA